MSIDWSDEAIEAAWNELFQEPYDGTGAPMINAALDAALAVQGCPKLPDCKTYADRAYADGRAEALEEAAKAVDAMFVFSGDETMRRTEKATILDAADVIRALKEKQG